MKTSRIFTLLCIVVCLSFFAVNREVEASEQSQLSQSTTSKTDTTAAEAPASKGSAGEPLPGGKGTSSTRAKNKTNGSTAAVQGQDKKEAGSGNTQPAAPSSATLGQGAKPGQSTR